MGISIDVTRRELAEVKTDALILPIAQDLKELPGPVMNIDKRLGDVIQGYIKAKRFSGAIDQVIALPGFGRIGAKNVILWGIGSKESYFGQGGFRALGILGRYLEREHFADAVFPLYPSLVFVDDYGLQARICGREIQYALYSFQHYKSQKRDKANLKRLVFALDPDLKSPPRRKMIIEKAVEGVAIAEAANFARTLGDTAPNDMTPARLAEEAKKTAVKYGLKYSLLGAEKIRKLGMGAFYSVARGSNEQACMIFLRYDGGRKKERPVVLAGKAVTFDTGGISLKKADKMEEMKYDMCGGAAVIGIMRAAAALRLPCNLIGIIPAAENMPGGKASRPGDIVTSLSGQTIEIISTDAEGRMLLADALSYAGRYQPDAIIDFATLTGAVIIALGHHASGLIGNNDGLLEALERAGAKSGERLWRLPLWDEYDQQLKSVHADMQNVGGRAAGTITAAAFLKRFVGKGTTWAHLDIAGTAWNTDSRPDLAKGATGVGVKLTIQYLEDRFGKGRE